MLAVPKLSEGESDEDRGEEVGYRVVKVGMLWQPSPALQEGEHGWPCAQEQEGGAHDGNGAPFVLYDEHLEPLFDGQKGIQKGAFNHLQASCVRFQNLLVVMQMVSKTLVS